MRLYIPSSIFRFSTHKIINNPLPPSQTDWRHPASALIPRTDVCLSVPAPPPITAPRPSYPRMSVSHTPPPAPSASASAGIRKKGSSYLLENTYSGSSTTCPQCCRRRSKGDGDRSNMASEPSSSVRGNLTSRERRNSRSALTLTSTEKWI